MKKLALKSLFVLALATSAALPVQAQTKIATIDLKKVFDSYYKTKQADVTLKERAADFDKSRKSMFDDYQKANEDYKKLLDSANDQAASSEERDKRKKNAEAKLLEIKEIEQNVTQFDRQSRTTLGEQQKHMRDNILREIRELITTKAKSSGFTLVVDTAAESINQTPVVLHTDGSNDMTDEIVKQLNANAPADISKSDTSPGKAGDKKDDKK